jgi:DNA-binding transcriptional ArsR family regulator
MVHLEDQLSAITRVGRALADPTRCRIMLALLASPRYPADLADELGLTRANVSNHLACLRGCGLVSTTPEGRQVRYQLTSEALRHALGDLLGVVLAVEEGEGCAVTAPAPRRSAVAEASR